MQVGASSTCRDTATFRTTGLVSHLTCVVAKRAVWIKDSCTFYGHAELDLAPYGFFESVLTSIRPSTLATTCSRVLRNTASLKSSLCKLLYQATWPPTIHTGDVVALHRHLQSLAGITIVVASPDESTSCLICPTCLQCHLVVQ